MDQLWISKLTCSSSLLITQSRSDNVLWGFIKEKIATTHYRTIEELKDAVLAVFWLVAAQMLEDM
jgi:hypothetical protein